MLHIYRKDSAFSTHMRTLLITLLSILSFQCYCQISINEVSSNNETLLLDNYGEASDWIELYNFSDNNINLEGFALSDSGDDVQKWIFPNIEMPPQSFLIVFASDRNETNPVLHANFKISSNGETLYLSDANNQLISSLTIPSLSDDISYGRLPDGSKQLFYFDEATPDASNENGNFLVFAPDPVFENTNYFHESAATISLSCANSDCKIYYTLDGSTPSEESFLYTEPFLLDQSASIRAIAFGENVEPSNIVTQTYFIDDNQSLPIVNITVEDSILFDPINGLFEFGEHAESDWPYWGANFWENKEIPVHFEYFLSDQSLAYQHEIGLKTHGGRGSRTNTLKSIRLLAKNKYGLEHIEYPFFETRSRSKYKRIVLRNASGDFGWAYMRDAFMANFILEEGFDIDCLASKPVLWYINGQFHGLMYLREKSDEYFLANNFGVEIDSLDLLEFDTSTIIGNREHFEAFYDFTQNNDLSDPSHYEYAASQMDIQSLVDYFVIQTLSNNTDWPANNIKYWRERKVGAKWRYLLFDMDVALGARSWSDADVDSFGGKMTDFDGLNKHINIMQAFLANQGFRHYFINRYADIINTSYVPEYLVKKVDQHIDQIIPYMPRQLEKWDIQSYEEWSGEKLDEIYEFVEDRPTYARDYLQSYFDLEAQIELELNVYPPNAGTIRLNTIEPHQYPWKGIYYKGVPVSMEIIPNTGYQFKGWQALHSFSELNSNPQFSFNFEEHDAVTAVFETTKEQDYELTVFPNPITENTVQFSFVLDEISEVQYSVYSTNGQLVYQSPSSILNAGLHRPKIKLSNLKTAENNQVFVLYLDTKTGTVSQPFIMLHP